MSLCEAIGREWTKLHDLVISRSACSCHQCLGVVCCQPAGLACTITCNGIH